MITIDEACLFKGPIYHFNYPELTKELQHEESDSYYVQDTAALAWFEYVVLSA